MATVGLVGVIASRVMSESEGGEEDERAEAVGVEGADELESVGAEEDCSGVDFSAGVDGSEGARSCGAEAATSLASIGWSAFSVFTTGVVSLGGRETSVARG